MYAPVQAGDEATAAAEEPCVDARALEAAKADESLAGALEGDAALPSVGRRWLRFAVVAASSFLLNATSSVIIIVMPRIAEDLDASLSSVLWVSLAHSLVTCALNSGAGLLGDVVGHRRLWYAGMAVRAAAQLCSGLAPSLPALVACRAAAGVGGAMDGPSGIALVLRAFPPERKPFLVALCTAVGTSAQSAGMILGAVVACVQIKSSTRLQCARNRTDWTRLFRCASRTRREQSIRPKISRIDFDLTELEISTQIPAASGPRALSLKGGTE